MLTIPYYTGKGLSQDWHRYIKENRWFLLFSPFLLAPIFAAWIWMGIPLAFLLGFNLKTILIGYGITSFLLGSWNAVKIYVLEEYFFLRSVYEFGDHVLDTWKNK